MKILIRLVGSPAAVLLLFVAISVLSAFGILRVQVDSSIHSMLVRDDPARAFHEAAKKDFGSDEIVSIAIPFGDALTADAISAQVSLWHRIESVQDVVEVKALVNQDDVIAIDDELRVGSLLELAQEITEEGERSAWLRDRAREHPIWEGWLVSSDLSVAALHVEFDDGPSAQVRRADALQEIEAVLQEELGSTPYYFAGHPFMKVEITRAIADSLALLLPVSLLLLMAVLLVVTRSLVISITSVVSVAVAVFWMLGAMGWMGLSLTALSNAAPAILVALSAAYFVHFLLDFIHSGERSAQEAAQAAVARVGRPILLASGTTAIGYALLGLSSVPIVRDFGLSLSVGVVAAGLVGTVFLPCGVTMWPRIRRSRSNGLRILSVGTLFRLGCAICGKASLITAGSFSLAIVAIVLALNIRVDSSGPRRFASDSRFVTSSEFYRANLSGDVVESVYLSAPRGDFLDPDRLTRLARFVAAAKQLPEIDKVLSLADYIEHLYGELVNDGEASERLPETREIASQLMLLYESGGGGDDLLDYSTTDFKSVRVALGATVLSSSESMALQRDLDGLVADILPDESHAYSVVSTEMLMSRAAQAIAVEQIWGASLAVLLILALVGISHGSVWYSLVLLLPNVLPIAAIFALLAVLHVSVSDSTAMIATTAVGIAVDGSVHISDRFRTARREGLGGRAAALFSLVSVGSAVVVSSLLIVVGFSVLAFSSFRSISEMGLLTAVTMLFCLVADLVVLPAGLSCLSGGAREGAAVGLGGNEDAWIVAEGWDAGGKFLIRKSAGSMELPGRSGFFGFLIEDASGRSRADVPWVRI